MAASVTTRLSELADMVKVLEGLASI